MRKGFQKRRIALLIVGMLAIGQIPSGYVNAKESSVVQESSQVTSSEEETQAGEATDTKTTDAGTTETQTVDEGTTTNTATDTGETGVTDTETTNSDASNETKTDAAVTDEKQNVSSNMNTDIEPAKTGEITSQTTTPDTDGFVIEGTTLVDYTGTATDITIPSGVTCIGNHAFEVEADSNITSVIIPNSVTSIGEYAFASCSSLTSITIPDSVTSIGKYAFAYCSDLGSITIPNKLTNIEADTYYGCEELTSITIPNGVKSIGDEAFDSCKKLGSITIPNSVTSIGESAFSDCKVLTNLTIPDSVTSIDEHAFYNCAGLADTDGFIVVKNTCYTYVGSGTNITIPSGVSRIGNDAFNNCDNLVSVIIPDGVASIGDNAFYNCRSLTSISIPDGLTSIGYGAFYGCNALENNGFIIVKNICFQYIGSDTNITIPSGVTSIGGSAFFWNENLSSVTIPSTVTRIEDEAFYCCRNMKSVTMPDSVVSIGKNAFQGCENLSSLTMSNSVTSVGDYAFYGCTSLADITIPNTLTSIGDSSFRTCTSLKSIKIPDSVTSIGTNAFSGCNDRKVTKATSGQATVGEEDYFVMYCNANSYAYNYAQANKVYGILAVTPQDTVTVNVQSVALNQSIVNLIKGETITLTAAVSPSNATNKNVTWTSSDSNVASVDGTGKVTALSAGTATITVTTASGNKTATCTVNISNQQIKVSSIKLNTTKVTLAKKATINLVASVLPQNATNAAIIWSSSNEGVVTVSAGKVNAVSEGNAVITATAQDGSGVTATCIITVPKSASYKITYKMNKGTNAATNPTYYATGNQVKLENPTRKNYTFAGWYIGDKKVTSISKTTKGKITLTAKWDKVSVDKTTVKTAKNNKAGAITVSFDKVSGAKGYTVYYSTDKKLKGATTIDVSSKKKSASITGLTQGTTYYVTVKAYKVDSLGNIVYGKSNKTIKVKVKK